jgi:putative FmdB family regulatory protein
MPTYEYECNVCHKKFEVFQGITERPIKKCLHCGRPAARRLIGAGAGIIFKGSGFYQTDYRSEEYKAKAKAETAPTPSTTKPDTTSDTQAKPSKKGKKE